MDAISINDSDVASYKYKCADNSTYQQRRVFSGLSVGIRCQNLKIPSES